MRLFLTILSFAGIYLAYGQNWNQLTNFPATSRDDGCSFTINNVAYCGTGRDEGFQVTNDFYAFDVTTEQWSAVASLPDSAKRQYAAATEYASTGLLFGGINNQGNFLNDLWVYSPTINLWSKITIPCPFEGRSGAHIFVINDILYVVGGRTAVSDATNEVWAFDFNLSQWSQKNDMPGEGVWRGFGLQYNDVGIVGMGSDSTNSKRGEIYFYDPSIDFWIEMTQIETDPMNYPAVSLINDRLFVYGGEDTLGDYSNDFRYLDLTNLTWNALNSFPQDARRGAMAFGSSSDFYISTGLTTLQRLDETWVARDVVSVQEQELVEDLTIYVIDGVMILPDNLEKCSLFDNMGKLIPLTTDAHGAFRLPKGLSAGIYFCQGVKDGRMYQGKLLIQ